MAAKKNRCQTAKGIGGERQCNHLAGAAAKITGGENMAAA